MKQLLEWMQQKFRQKGTEPFKDSIIAKKGHCILNEGNCNPCLSAQSTFEDHNYDVKPSFGSRSLNKPKHESENSIPILEAREVEEIFNDETIGVASELFHGFLTIGTLGSQSIINEPPTPTFGGSVENLIEDKTEVTENDLKLINEEIEKFLEAEAKEEESNESSRRNSYVSITTISEKPIDGANSEEYEKILSCPLQKYLLGSSIEPAETIAEVKKEKTSLAELFHRATIIEEQYIERCGNGEIPHKKNHSSVKHRLTKLLKKFHAPSKSHTLSSSDQGSVSTKRKLHKVIQMFNKKIHPEELMQKKSIKSQKNRINSTSNNGGHNDGSLMQLDRGNRSIPQGLKEVGQCYKNNMRLPPYELSDSASKGKGEQWITTDADYLVLEL